MAGKKLTMKEERQLQGHIEALNESAEALDDARHAFNAWHGERFAELADARRAFEKAVEDFNEDVANQFQSEVQAAVDDFDDAVESADQWAAQIACDLREWWQGRSERWQESDAAQQHTDMTDEWEALTLERCDIEEPDEVEPESILCGDCPDDLNADDLTAGEVLEELPTEIE